MPSERLKVSAWHLLGLYVAESCMLLTAVGMDSLPFTKAECVHALEGLALLRASGEITLAGSRRQGSTLAAAPVL